MSAQPSNNEDLHGNAPDRSRIALLLIDVINDLDFPNNKRLIQASAALASRIASLKALCKNAGIPAIYVNDNHGKWRSDFSAVLRNSLRDDSPGKSMVEQLVPDHDDYIVLKPKHSAFFATPLETLLEYLGVKTVILTGITTNACVLITASDVYVRDLQLFVPCDCVAALTDKDQQSALEMMRRNFAADTRPSTELDLDALQSKESEAVTSAIPQMQKMA